MKNNPEGRRKIFLSNFRMFEGREKLMLAQAKEDPNKFFGCKTEWPYCKYDFYKSHTVVDCFTFKSETLLSKKLLIFDDYFNAEKLEQRAFSLPKKTKAQDLVIERGVHYCKLPHF